MKIGGNFPGFNISARGLSIQRKRMDLIAQNIASADSRNVDGTPYQRKILKIVQQQNPFSNTIAPDGVTLRLNTTDPNHISAPEITAPGSSNGGGGLNAEEITDNSQGDLVYEPDNPDAGPDGYVRKSNVNIITEMVDMISASRSYEANLTALNSSKQMVKDSLEI